MQDLRTALLELLWALPPGGPDGSGWPMGRSIDPNELRTAAGRTAGVQSIDGLAVYHRGNANSPWIELSEPKLELQPYQLPELMEVHVGEVLEPPTLVTQGDEPPTPLPAPVAPDIC